MPDPIFHAIIAVTDRTAGPLKAIGARLAHVGAPLREIGKRVSELGEAAGLERLAEAGKRAGERFKQLGEHVKALAGPLEALGAAASVGGMVEMVKSASEYGEGLFLAAQKTGVATDALARWHFAAKQTGVDAQTLDKGLEYLNRTIVDTVSGKNKEMAVMFQHMGISLRDSKGHIRDASTVMLDLAQAVKANKGNTPVITEITKAFGQRGGNELVPMLQDGKEGFQEFGDQAERLGLVLSAGAAKSADKFGESMKMAGGAMQGLSNAIGAQLFPVLTPMIDAFTNWIATNRELIASKLGDAIKEIGAALRSIDWNGIKSSLASIGDGFKDVASFIGPTRTAIGMLAIATLPFTAAILVSVGSLGKLGYELLRTAARLGVLAFAQVAGAIGTFATAIQSGTGIMAAFDAVMDANPIGLLIIAVVALAGAALLVYKNWTPIKAFFAELWDGITAIFASAWAKIKPIVDFVAGGAHDIARFFHFGGADAAAPGAVAADAGSPPPRLYGPGSPAAAPAGAPGENGQLHIKVDVNAPPGTKVAARSTGAAPEPDLDVGMGFAY